MHIDADPGNVWIALCGAADFGVNIEVLDVYRRLEDAGVSWCPKCEADPRLPLLILAITEL